MDKKEQLKLLRIIIATLEDNPDYATLQFNIGGLEELEKALLAEDRAKA